MTAMEKQGQGHHVNTPMSRVSMLGMAGVFLKLGTIGFGGDMAVISTGGIISRKEDRP